MDLVSKRVVIHFPGFEPLDAAAHHERYGRAAAQSADVWNCRFETGPLESDQKVPHFTVAGSGPNWRTAATIHILDHYRLIDAMLSESLPAQLAKGYASFIQIVLRGGLWGYFRHAWRFGLFCLFPFVLTGIAFAVTLAIVALPYSFGIPPWHFAWSVSIAFVFFRYLFMPFSKRFHTLLLFADWRLGVALATLDDVKTNARLFECETVVKRALAELADEYLITSHSMGSILAVHTIGALLEREPVLLAGKRVVFATLGSVLLQSALLRPASRLRARVGLLLRTEEVSWFDVQTRTDLVHFYKASVAPAVGHGDAPEPKVVRSRLRHILMPERYARIKTDFLRVHRQYVLAPDRRAPFDFTLVTAGPLPAATFAGFSQHHLPPIGQGGAVLRDTAKAAEPVNALL